eukprot:m.113096 g.113096  ORF g.113096 m.113096 type:complete len:407 (-) comp17061_c0_seq1:86-1306(-)
MGAESVMWTPVDFLSWRGMIIGSASAAVIGFACHKIWCKSPEDKGVINCSTRQSSDGIGIAALIGNTPMVEIRSLSRLTGCRILAKCEMLNPGGSTKDRVAKQIIHEAHTSEILKSDKCGTIVEGTAGSTGISLALLARAYGHKCKIFMPDDMAQEKSDVLKLLGADVVRLPAVSIVNNKHFCKVAEAYARDTPNAVFANQFENLANFRAHYYGTGPEIWQQTNGKLDAFVMAAGTGGTIAGVGSYLHERNPNIKVVLVDPPGSALYNKIEAGVLYASEQSERRLRRNRYDTITEGIGIDRLTANFAKALPVVSKAFRGSDLEAVEMANFLLRNDGLFVGSSSAMNCVGVVRTARMLGPGHTIVTILCDGGARSMSKMYNPAFLKSRGLFPTAHTRDVDDLGFVAE